MDDNSTTIEITIKDDSTIINNVNEQQLTKTLTPSILTKLHAGYFRICISLASQALLWKTLSEKTNASLFHHHAFAKLPSTAFLLLWCLAFCLLLILSLLYLLRCIFHFHLVKAEFLHHVGANYLFAPWISWLLLFKSVTFLVPESVSHQLLCLTFIIPVVVLDVKMYGQWFTTEKKFLSTLANPTSQISVLGNLVGAWAATRMGWKESGVCIFTLGMTHYLIVFITLYQRLSGGNHLPARLRPVFFLFVAAPSMASLAWSSINGSFDILSKMLFFLSLFLFTSLVCRPAFFKKSMKKYNIAWWAYSFPLTFLALASAEYAKQVKTIAASVVMLTLSVLSVLVFICLLVSSGLNADMLFCEKDVILNFGATLGSTKA